MPKVPPRVAQILEKWRGRADAAKPQQKATAVTPAGRQIALGKNEFGEIVRLPESARLWHLHVIGPTGTGKSNFLEHVIRRDIEDGRGVMLIDPHGGEPGSVYRSVLSWMEQHTLTSSRTVHLIDPNETGFVTGLNPLARLAPETDLSVIAAETLAAFEQAWGGENTLEKPTIRRVLRTAFTAAAELGLTLAEVPLLFDQEDQYGLRSLAIRRLTNDYAKRNLEQLQATADAETSKRDFRAEVRGPINRVEEFLAAEAIVAMVGQTTRVLDFRSILDGGDIVLANLQGRDAVHESEMRLLGALLVRAVASAMMRRSVHAPYFVTIDECQNYLTGDIPKLLAEARKMGVGLTLGHQFLWQLRERGEGVYQAVKNTARIKMVFGAASQVEARELAEDLFTVNDEEVVQALVRPTLIGHQTVIRKGGNSGRAKSESVAETVATGASETVGASSSWAEGTGSGELLSQLLSPDMPGFFAAAPVVLSQTLGSNSSTNVSAGGSEMQAASRSQMSSRAMAQSSAASESDSWSEQLEPILENRPTGVHSVDTMLYRAARSLLALPTGTGVLGLAGRARVVAVPLAPNVKLDNVSFAALKQRVLAASPSAKPANLARKEIFDRQRKLLATAGKPKAVEPEEPASFWNKGKAGSLPKIGRSEVFGLLEYAFDVVATIDTGATISAIISTEVEEFEQDDLEWVRVQVLTAEGQQEVIESAIEKRVHIGGATGKQQDAPVFTLGVRLGSVEVDLEFAVLMHDNKHEVLIGTPFLQRRFLVDSAREFLLTAAPR